LSRQRILVVNPNSTEAVTTGISQSLSPLRSQDGPDIECATLAEGPPGIETAAHIESVVEPLLRLMEKSTASAYVIACFSDPGLGAARRARPEPVYGIAESAFKEARTLGERFGIIAIKEESTKRHRRYVRKLGFERSFAASLPVGLGVTELLDEQRTLDRLIDVGARLRDDKGADILVLGCTGMAPYRETLERKLARPVIDPCQAAVREALARLTIPS
jgi:Asp/Glu/hydantoin racemase